MDRSSGHSLIRAWRSVVIGSLPVIVALAGCAGTPEPSEPAPANVGEVGAKLLLPPTGAARIQPQAHQRFIYPSQIDPVAMPAYPQALLPQRLPPVEVCVELDIGADGRVFDARRRIDEACAATDPAHADAFATAALRAVRAWSYEPAYLCQAPEGFAGDDPCTAEGMVERPTPLRLSYAFRFSQRDGAPSVERVGGGRSAPSE